MAKRKREGDVEVTKTREFSLIEESLAVFMFTWGNGEGATLVLDNPNASAPDVRHDGTHVQLSWEQWRVVAAVLGAALDVERES